MKINEEVLHDVLRLAIADANKKPKAFIDKIKETMIKRYDIPPADTTEILNGKIPLEIMSPDMMFKITKVLCDLNKHLDDGFDVKKLDIDLYFTEREKEDFNKKIDREAQDKDVIFENWLQVSDDQYICVVSIDDVLDLTNRNKIRYNPKTQRQLTIKETKSGAIKQITLNTESLKEIHGLMTNNDFISDALTLNVNPDLYNPPRILRNKIVIGKDSVIDIIDGYHRLTEMIIVKTQNPNWEFKCIFNLMVFNEQKAVKYILQQDKKNHLTEEQVEQSDPNDATTFIINRLNESSNFHLKNTIGDISFTINKIIRKLFNPNKLITPEDRRDAVLLCQKIESSINSIIEKNNFDKVSLSKEEWFVYLYILKHCSDNNLDFMTTLDRVNVKDLLNNIKFVNEPTTKNYKLLKEVIKNVY